MASLLFVPILLMDLMALISGTNSSPIVDLLSLWGRGDLTEV